MNRKFLVAAGVATLLAGVGVTGANAGATKGGAAQLSCLVDAADTSSNTCVVSAGTAKLTLATPGAGIYVYQATNAVPSTPLSSLNQLGFSYTSGLAPRLNIPVDQAAYDGGVYDYVFVEGGTCNDGYGNVKPLTNSVCSVVYALNVTGVNGPGTSTTYPSWAAFTADNPTVATVNNDSNQPYVIQDTPGSGSVSNVQLGHPSISGKKK